MTKSFLFMCVNILWSLATFGYDNPKGPAQNWQICDSHVTQGEGEYNL